MFERYPSAKLEQFLVEERRILQECVRLLTHRVPLIEWDERVRIAFVLALRGREGKEAYKAFSMARHLGIVRPFHADELPEKPTVLQQRCSERIRADLAKLVQLGAGRYLRHQEAC